MNKAHSPRTNMKELANYFCTAKNELPAEEICNTYNLSLDAYYRWKCTFKNTDTSVLEKIFRS